MVRLTGRPDMTLDVYRGRKTTKQQQQQMKMCILLFLSVSYILRVTALSLLRYLQPITVKMYVDIKYKLIC